MTQGYIHSLESFGSVDGPGVRYLIFTTGCAMRCQFCHNPDTWNMNSGTLYTADELIDKAWKYRTYWGSKGGITVSGGEPLLQIDFLLELFQKAKERGINTTLDTCGNPFTREEPFFSKFQELMKVTDLVMLDIKHIDDEQHKILTGQTNKNILDMARYLSDTGKPVWIRHVLVPERSDKDEYLHRLHDFIETLDNVEKVEVLPYHTLGVYKWKELGIPYQLEGIDPPSKERVKMRTGFLKQRNIMHRICRWQLYTLVSTGPATGSSLRMHGNKNYGAHRNMCSVIFLLYQSMQEKLPVASSLYHAIVKSFRLSKRLQECIEWIEINKVYKKYDKKSFLVCKM